MVDNLSHLRICVERPLPNEEHIMKQISDRSNSSHHHEKLRAAFLTQKLWPKTATIKVSFVGSPKNVDWTPIAVLKGMRDNQGNTIKIDPIEEEIRTLSPIDAIKTVVRKRIQPMVGLKFAFVSQGGDVRISFNPYAGAYSLVGTDCIRSTEESTMNLGWLDAGTIIHEFGHVLGLIHEHQNPKGKSIQWDESKVYEWAKQTQGWDHETTYHNIIERYDINQLNASKFDPKSIMLYFFPPQLTTNNKGTTSNHQLSLEDITYISKMYPGGQIQPTQFHAIIEEKRDQNNTKKFNWKTTLYICIAILLGLIIIYLIVKFYMKKKERKTKKYFQTLYS